MTPAAVHRQTAERVRSAMVVAMRADTDRLNAALLSASGLARPEADFAREARGLVLALAAALTTVLRVHRRGQGPYGDDICLGCGVPDCRTVRVVGEALVAYQVRPVVFDRSEAWRRADAWFSREDAGPITIEEFEAGFIARAADHPNALVLDRHTGALIACPDLPDLAHQYIRYRHTNKA